jgi:hypothetical protein
MGAMVVRRCALLRVVKDFRASLAMALANLSNASMHKVGTKVGTVDQRAKLLTTVLVFEQID